MSQLRLFLGLVNYHNRFLCNASTVLHPLHQLLEQDNEWQWTEQCEQAFTEANRMITSEPLLRLHDPALSVRVACDASPTGIGAVFSHVMPDGSERPVAFATPAPPPPPPPPIFDQGRAQVHTDRQGSVVNCVVKRLHVYLYGRRFTFLTDHKLLTAIFHPKKVVPAMTAGLCIVPGRFRAELIIFVRRRCYGRPVAFAKYGNM